MNISIKRYRSDAVCGFLSVFFVFAGCGKKTETGKFTPEQMEQIPLAEKDNLPEPSGTMVLNIKGHTITADEIAAPVVELLRQSARDSNFEKFRQQARQTIKQAVSDKVTDILLYEQAKKNAPENIDELLDKAVESELKRFITNHNNNYSQAQNTLEKMGMDWRTFRDYQKKLIMTQSYLSGELKKDITIGRAEMTEYYESIKDRRFRRAGKIQFRLIDIIPGKFVFGQGDTAEEVAGKMADDLMLQLNNGADFAELAEIYSHDHRAQYGGLWTPVTEGSELAKPYNAILEAIAELQPGQLAGPIKTEGHIFIVKLESRQQAGFIPFESVQHILEDEMKFLNRRKAYEEFISKFARQGQVENLDWFVDFCLDKVYKTAATD